MMIRQAIARFRELHEQYKAGAFKTPEAVASYESEREAFMQAFVQAQQLALKPGQSPRQSLRVARTERLMLVLGPRREGTVTVDIAVGGFSAQVGPLAVAMFCEFEMGSEPEMVRGRARVVASTRQADGSCRTSFSIQTMGDPDRKRLEIWVIDSALQAIGKR